MKINENVGTINITSLAVPESTYSTVTMMYQMSDCLILLSFKLTIQDLIDFPNNKCIPKRTENHDHKTVI